MAESALVLFRGGWTASVRLAFAAVLWVTGAHAVCAEDQADFSGKTITMIIGYPSGGGTDAAGRLIAAYLAKYLPGQPALTVRNMPGADGINALNHIVLQTKPDGLTVTMGSSSQTDPLNFRKPIAKYDPSTLAYVGGVGRGGTVILINKDAEPRLYERSAAPVTMGSNSALPRQGMQVTLWCVEYLNWNAKWIVGYPGTNEVMLALERGEVDMTSTGNMFQIQRLVNTGRFKVLNQSGAIEHGQIVARADFREVPVFPDLLAGKLNDPLVEKAFRYWLSMNAMDKWIALAPGTPEPVVAAYRAAFQKASDDPTFVQRGKEISDDFTPMSNQDIEFLVKALVDTPDEATEYTKVLMRKQGLRIE